MEKEFLTFLSNNLDYDTENGLKQLLEYHEIQYFLQVCLFLLKFKMEHSLLIIVK